LPAWLAVIEQVPGAMRVTVAPETVQTGTVVEAKLTGSPELAVALRLKGAEPATTLLNGPKAIV
jgi:hypothetical protein